MSSATPTLRAFDTRLVLPLAAGRTGRRGLLRLAPALSALCLAHGRARGRAAIRVATIMYGTRPDDHSVYLRCRAGCNSTHSFFTRQPSCRAPCSACVHTRLDCPSYHTRTVLLHVTRQYQYTILGCGASRGKSNLSSIRSCACEREWSHYVPIHSPNDPRCEERGAFAIPTSFRVMLPILQALSSQPLTAHVGLSQALVRHWFMD